MSAISDAVRLWKTEEITWEDLVEVMHRIPLRTRRVEPPAETAEEQWRRAEEEPHNPGSWDDLYMEWLFKQLIRPQFEELERVLLSRR